jgi:hypothetical protein
VTDSTAALAAALVKVQAELPEIERDRTVEVQKKDGGTYSYSYVTLATLTKAVMPLLAKHGLAFTAMPGTGADGKMCLRYHLLHESGERLTGEFPISGEGGIQMVGGRISYSRRYCLAALAGVAADEDDESKLDDGARGTAQRAARPRQAAPPKTDRAQAQRARATEPPPLPGEENGAANKQASGQQKALHALFKERGITTHDQRVNFAATVVGHHVESTSDLSYEETSRVLDVLKAGPPGQQQADPADNPGFGAQP